ncbi:hypothetical protein [Okeania sp. KiyG1]|nr:hypothetical protein [Okeania sp. KiyG1]
MNKESTLEGGVGDRTTSPIYSQASIPFLLKYYSSFSANSSLHIAFN